MEDVQSLGLEASQIGLMLKNSQTTNLPKIVAYGQTGLLVVDGRGISAEHSLTLWLPNQAV